MASFVLFRGRVRNFEAWKKAYDAHLAVRQEFGLSDEHVLRGADDQDEVFILRKVSNLDRAKAFVASPGVGEAIEKSGVVGKPDVYFLKS
jgi:hypothetical protein